MSKYSSPELQKVFDSHPDVPELAIWKAVLTAWGISLTDNRIFTDLEGIGEYKTKKAKKLPVARDGRVIDEDPDKDTIIPSEVLLTSTQGRNAMAKLGYRNGSPIGIMASSVDDISLFERDSELLIPVGATLVRRRDLESVQIPTFVHPNSPRVGEIMNVLGDSRMSIITVEGCWNWNMGTPCHFCDLNPKTEDYASAKPTTNTIPDFEGDVGKWWAAQRENYLAAVTYAYRHLIENGVFGSEKELLVMSGMFPQAHQAWDIALEVIDALNAAQPISSVTGNVLNIGPHNEIQALEVAKSKGVAQVQYNLEVIGAELFSKVCAGKIPYEQFVEKLREAVQVMGAGNVRSNFVLGLQPIEELMSGVQQLADMGIVADVSIFQPKRGTKLASHPAPTLDDVLRFTKFLADTYKQYGFQPLYGPLNYRSSIINECM